MSIIKQRKEIEHKMTISVKPVYNTWIHCAGAIVIINKNKGREWDYIVISIIVVVFAAAALILLLDA